MGTPSRLSRNIGWALSFLVAAMLLFGMARWVGFVEPTTTVLYLVPRTTCHVPRCSGPSWS